MKNLTGKEKFIYDFFKDRVVDIRGMDFVDFSDFSMFVSRHAGYNRIYVEAKEAWAYTQEVPSYIQLIDDKDEAAKVLANIKRLNSAYVDFQNESRKIHDEAETRLREAQAERDRIIENCIQSDYVLVGSLSETRLPTDKYIEFENFKRANREMDKVELRSLVRQKLEAYKVELFKQINNKTFKRADFIAKLNAST